MARSLQGRNAVTLNQDIHSNVLCKRKDLCQGSWGTHSNVDTSHPGVFKAVWFIPPYSHLWPEVTCVSRVHAR